MSLAIVALLLGALWLALANLRRGRRNDGKLPPGPPTLPIIGNFHLLGNNPHANLRRLAQKYGPIMSMRFGSVPTIIVSSPEAAELVSKTHDAVFASRPQLQVAEMFSYGGKGIVLTEYGSYLRSVRRLCAMKLLSPAKIESFSGLRREEMRALVQRLEGAAAAREAADVSQAVAEAVEDMTCRMILGRSRDERFDFVKMIEEAFHLVGEFNIGDYLPYLKPFDIQGLNRRSKETNDAFDKALETLIDERMQIYRTGHDARQHRDFVDELLSLVNKPMDSSNSADALHIINRTHIKAILRDLLAGAMDTSITTIDWIMAELMRHPRVMRKLQDELRIVVEMNKMVEEMDLPNLPYLDMVMKEGFRLHIPGPLLAPRESLEDITINGYFIPKKSRILINVWMIGRDPNIWSDNAEEFFPERFEKDNADIQGRDFRILPFGSGRRGCPGSRLGILNVQLIVAQLMHCFDWELPKGMLPSDMDMSEKLGGLNLPRAQHLLALPTYRLKC